MIAKCACQQCGNPIEFEAENSGEFVQCPHCHQTTVLELPHKKTVTVQVKPPEPKLSPPPPKTLTLCGDCLADISINATRCPACGAPRTPGKGKHSSTGIYVFAVLFFLLGGGLIVNGLDADSEAKTVFQQSPAFTEMATGVILCALSVVMFACGKIADAVANK